MMEVGKMEVNMEMVILLTVTEQKEMENGMREREPNGLVVLMMKE